MIRITDEKHWKELLEKDSKLKQLAIKASVENNFERAKELNGCFAWNCGDDVVKSEEERDLARYLFCMTDVESMNKALQQRVDAARRAGISINDL